MKNSNTHKQLVKKLFSLLEEMEISLYQVWKKTKLDQSYLSKVKSGKELLSMNSLLKICEGFNFGLDLFLKGKKNKLMLDLFSSIDYNNSNMFSNIKELLCFPKTRLMQITSIQV